MNDPRPVRDLERLKWVGVALPIAFVWVFEVVRFYLTKDHEPADEVHVVAAIAMAAAVLVFGVAMAHLLERTQREIVHQNRDMTALQAVGTAVHSGLGLEDIVREALDRLAEQTGALAGVARLAGGPGSLAVRWPAVLPGGLEWLAPILDAPPHGARAPRFAERRDLETLILDVPFISAGEWLGHLRLAFHPPLRPALSLEALARIGEEIATAVRLTRLVADLERRQLERAALYEVALQLTGRAETRDVLDTITHHARALLGADRAVVCLADVTEGHATARLTDRLAITDAGRSGLIRHIGDGPSHATNPHCPFRDELPETHLLVHPLRGPDGSLGELCVSRQQGAPFGDAERSLLGAFADMAAIAVRTARLGEAEEQWTILSERDRIARELHDSLAQVLGHIHLRLRALEHRLDGAAPLVGPELAEIATVADEAYKDVREAILGLRETISPETGLEGTLREYLAKYSRQTGIVTSLTCDAQARAQLPPRAEVQLLRVVQEALTNVRKHARASRATVRIQLEEGAPVLVVEDDGVGFDPGAVSGSFTGGFGMTSMRERVEQVGGTLAVHTSVGAGTRVVVRLNNEGTSDASPATPARAAGR